MDNNEWEELLNNKTINIFGEDWTILVDDEKTSSEDALGLTYVYSRTIYISKESCIGEEGQKDFALLKRVVRHEVIHAALFESGLETCAHNADDWADDEEIVDWIAIQFPKLYKIFKELKVI